MKRVKKTTMTFITSSSSQNTTVNVKTTMSTRKHRGRRYRGQQRGRNSIGCLLLLCCLIGVMFSSTSTAFASDTDNTSVEDKNDEYLDLLGEIDAEIEGEFSDEFTIKSDIQVQMHTRLPFEARLRGTRNWSNVQSISSSATITHPPRFDFA